MAEDALIPIGKIVGTHGMKSHLKVISCGDSVDLFAPGKELAVSPGGDTNLTKCVHIAPLQTPSSVLVPAQSAFWRK